MHGIRVMSASVSLALNPIIDSNNWVNPYWKPYNPAQTSDGPNYSRARKACGTMIPLEQWVSMNARSIACSVKKHEELTLKVQDATARKRERNLRKQVLRELEQFNVDTWQPTAGSCERASSAINMDQKHTREMRNRTKVVRHGGILVQKTETYTNCFTGEETQSSYSERVGAISFYRYHDSHGQHGRKARYKDVPRGDEPQSSHHFRTKHTRNNHTGDLITA